MKSVLLTPRFVESIPEGLEGGVLYVSMTFATAMHLCACGCGREVVTPLSSTDWKLWFDGEHITLDPSVGNWSFPCRSHYWIRKNGIRWAPSMSETAVRDLRALDRARKAASRHISGYLRRCIAGIKSRPGHQQTRRQTVAVGRDLELGTAQCPKTS